MLKNGSTILTSSTSKLNLDNFDSFQYLSFSEEFMMQEYPLKMYQPVKLLLNEIIQ